MEKVIEKVMTLAEASVKWGIPVTTQKIIQNTVSESTAA